LESSLLSPEETERVKTDIEERTRRAAVMPHETVVETSAGTVVEKRLNATVMRRRHSEPAPGSVAAEPAEPFHFEAEQPAKEEPFDGPVFEEPLNSELDLPDLPALEAAEQFDPPPPATVKPSAEGEGAGGHDAASHQPQETGSIEPPGLQAELASESAPASDPNDGVNDKPDAGHRESEVRAATETASQPEQDSTGAVSSSNGVAHPSLEGPAAPAGSQPAGGRGDRADVNAAQRETSTTRPAPQPDREVRLREAVPPPRSNIPPRPGVPPRPAVPSPGTPVRRPEHRPFEPAKAINLTSAAHASAPSLDDGPRGPKVLGKIDLRKPAPAPRPAPPTGQRPGGPPRPAERSFRPAGEAPMPEPFAPPSDTALP